MRLAFLLAFVGAAALFDWRSLRIPNWLTLPAAAVSLACAGSRWPAALAGVALASGVYLLLFSLLLVGAGDVKLMAAVGAIVGPAAWVTIFFSAALAGAVFAAVRGRYQYLVPHAPAVVFGVVVWAVVAR